MQSPRSLVLIGALLGLIPIVLGIVALVTPKWIKILHINFSLLVCGTSNICLKSPRSNITNGLEIAGVAAIAIGVILSVILGMFTKNRWIYLLPQIFLISGPILILIGILLIELTVDNRVNRSTLSANGIRNAVSLQPVLYVGGVPNNNNINLTGSGLNAHGFQGCLSSFIVDGRLLDYQRALVLNGQVKMNVCSDLNKLCYDFTCIHSGICSTNEKDEPSCDCIETSYIGERCDKLPKGFYFGKHHSIGSIEYVIPKLHQTDNDIISFGLQTLSMSAQIFRLESDFHLYSLEYEIVRERSYIKLNMGTKQPDVYSGVAHVTDGMYHAIKIIRQLSTVELYVDGIRIKLEGGNKYSRQLEQQALLKQRRLRIGGFKNVSHWNGIIAGLC
ncbi:unnamed protein product [Rotaria sp. Silwood2]|nr:unnamed protein product [Rotaria sp. Silwood2]